MLKLSLQNKIIYTILIFSILALTIVAYIGYKYSKDAHRDKIIYSEYSEVKDIALSIEQKLLVMTEDANFIANFYAMQKLLSWKVVGIDKNITRWDTATKNTFKSLIDLKSLYYKLRVLDLDGFEQINVFYDSKKQKSVIQSKSKLQNRSKERYFKDILNLNAGEVYVSQMELNSEFGKITYPYVPIVHFSSVIYDNDGNKKGVAVINAYASLLTDAIVNLKHLGDSNSSQRYLIDNDGYFMYHSDKEKCWGKQLGTEEKIQKYHPEVFNAVSYSSEGLYYFDNKLFTYKRIYPDSRNKKEYWIIISEVEEDVVFSSLRDFEYMFLLISLVTMFLLIYFVQMYISKILSPLNLITQQLKSLSDGEIKVINIDYSYEDEVSNLIDSSKKLVKNMNDIIEQTNSVASGDFTKRILVNSNSDTLGNSINLMTDRLESVSILAKKLSKGDISENILVTNSQDTLGIALNELLNYLTQITTVAESISIGDFDVEFKLASQQDRLGLAINGMTKTLKQVVINADNIAKGDFSQNIVPRSDKDSLGFALQEMTLMLNKNREKNLIENWTKDGLGRLSNTLSGVEDLNQITNATVGLIVKHLDAASGIFFLYDSNSNDLFLQSSYSFVDRDSLYTRFKEGEGVIGQVFLERKPILLKNIKQKDFNIETGIISQAPLNTYTFPLIYEGNIIGVIEIASFNIFAEKDKKFMDSAANLSSAFIYNVQQNRKIKKLLEESQIAFEELQVKSEELQQSNVQMEEQQQQLEIQAKDLKIKNSMLEKTKKELDIRATQLEKSSQYKSEFLANMSHELRTPLNSIILLAKMLSEDSSGNIDEDDIKKAQVIHKSGKDLLLLINDILDLSKIESGKMDLIKDKFTTSDLVTDIEDLFSPIANEKSLDFIINDNFKSYLYTDRTKLMQVIKNLLSNAFKFTKKGSVAFNINYYKDLDLPILISIKDSGIGIPRDKKDMVFDAFKQIDGSISREYGGTGLGLSISKNFTELIGGRLSLDSEYRVGSTFTIHLPMNESSKVEKSESIDIGDSENRTKNSLDRAKEFDTTYEKESKIFLDNEIQNSDTNKIELRDSKFLQDKTVLIADDDSRNIFSLSALLQKEGANTVYALNGEEALTKLSNESIDLIIMDIMMPKMDGYTAIEKIREQDKFKNLPIIAVTAKAMKDDREKCIKVGANDYLSKPVEPESLLFMIKAWISK